MGNRLQDQVAIVTGASSGNGRAIALAMAAEGAKIVVSDLREEALAGGYEEDIELSTAEAIKKAGGQTIYHRADASKKDDVEELVAKAVSEFGRLDIMVCNAGVFTGVHTIVDETEEQFDFTMAVNIKGVWLGNKYAIKQFMAQERRANGVRGRIVNIASIGGLVGLALEPAYCASKGAVVNLTRQIAVDYAAEQINVNCICPGFLATAMVRPFLEDKDLNQGLHQQSPWPHLGTPEDVAKSTVFLASDDALWMTGSAITVDGGFTAR